MDTSIHVTLSITLGYGWKRLDIYTKAPSSHICIHCQLINNRQIVSCPPTVVFFKVKHSIATSNQQPDNSKAILPCYQEPNSHWQQFSNLTLHWDASASLFTSLIGLFYPIGNLFHY